MGSNTTHGYFYKPAYGAKGTAELALFDAKLDATDLIIKDLVDNKQPLDAGLTSIAGLTTATNKMIYTTGLDTYAIIDLTAFARSILDDADEATFKATVNLEIGTDVQAYDATLLSIAALGTAADKIAYTTGIDTWAETVLTAAGRAILDDADNVAQLVTLGLTATAAELNILDGALLTVTELNYVGGVTSAIQTQIDGKLANILEDTTPELGGEMDCGAHSIGFTQQTVTYNVTTTTVDWRLGNKATMTFGAGNIGTFAFTNPTNPCNVVLKVIQDGTGSRVVTAWDADIKWAGGSAPTLTTGANTIDVISLYWDGTNYFGVASLAFS